MKTFTEQLNRADYNTSMVVTIGRIQMVYSDGDLVAIAIENRGWISTDFTYHKRSVARWLARETFAAKQVSKEDLNDIFDRLIVEEAHLEMKKRMLGQR